MSCPAHIEIIAEEQGVEVAKEKDDSKPRLSKKRVAQLRASGVKVGGGI
jgi:hypothetical protein